MLSAQWTGAGHIRRFGHWALGVRDGPRPRPRASREQARTAGALVISRSSLFVDRTAAQQLMRSRPGRRHVRSSRARIAYKYTIAIRVMRNYCVE